MANELTLRRAQILDTIKSQESLLVRLTPQGVPASIDKLIASVRFAMANNAAISDCTPASILSSVMTATAMGLRPDGVLGGGYIVPYRDGGTRVAQFIPGYRGLVELAIRCGAATSLRAVAVYEHDRFIYSEGLTPNIDHVPAMNVEDRGKLVAVYAVATIKDAPPVFVVMTRKEVDAIRSKAKTDKVWGPHFDEMAKKTAIRRLCKTLPLQADAAEPLALALQAQAAAEAGRVVVTKVTSAGKEGEAPEVEFEGLSDFPSDDEGEQNGSNGNGSSDAVKAAIERTAATVDAVKGDKPAPRRGNWKPAPKSQHDQTPSEPEDLDQTPLEERAPSEMTEEQRRAVIWNLLPKRFDSLDEKQLWQDLIDEHGSTVLLGKLRMQLVGMDKPNAHKMTPQDRETLRSEVDAMCREHAAATTN